MPSCDYTVSEAWMPSFLANVKGQRAGATDFHFNTSVIPGSAGPTCWAAIPMDIQRLRNLTTGRLHTTIGDVYEDLEFITRGGGIMTHMIPRVCRAIEPWLREQVADERFWDGEYDVTHVGDFPLEPMSEEENAKAMQRYSEMPNPLDGKEVIVVAV